MNRQRWRLDICGRVVVVVIGVASCVVGVPGWLAGQRGLMALSALAEAPASASSSAIPNAGAGGYTYNPVGRRDPFAPVLPDGRSTTEQNAALPPLQRVTLTELTLIGIVWGGFGYNAMVQTPDGKGYTIHRGTPIGPNNGVVSAITESTVTIEERFTDLYGKKQVREHVLFLRPKERAE